MALNVNVNMSDGGGSGGADLFLNAGQLAEHSRSISVASTNYLDAVNEIRKAVSALTSNGEWSGTDTSSFGTTVLNKLPKMDELGESIAQYSKNIQQRADELVSASTSIAGAASNL